jgi:ATP-dependent protease HslVU (ClpYQ) peptidase subunit
VADQHAQWTQEAIAILMANVVGGIDAGADMVGTYLREEPEDWRALALKATALLTGMENTALILLMLLEQSTERTRGEILRDAAQLAETWRDD